MCYRYWTYQCPTGSREPAGTCVTLEVSPKGPGSSRTLTPALGSRRVMLSTAGDTDLLP